MTVEHDIRKWALERPAWQQEVLVALARGEKFEPERISALADRLLQPGSEKPSRAAADLALGSTAFKQVRLANICSLKGVNALADGQTLSFAPEGLTVVYGHNGSGKSGYARLIKGMVSARHFSEVLPDVFKDNAPNPSAEVTYQVDGADASEKFPATAPVDDLQRIHFYDEHCGDAYLNRESTITYRPSALILFEALIATCGAVRNELQRRIAANEQKRLKLPVAQETAANVFLSKLSRETTDAEIDQATTLAAAAKGGLGEATQEVTRLESSDATKEQVRLQNNAAQVKRLQAQLTELTNAVSNDRLEAIRKLRDDAIVKREAASLAANNTFDTEPLTGIGSQTWRALWDAARAFALTEAYHGHAFPETREGSLCVLCQQPLGDAAKDRFGRFNRFMTDVTQRDATTAERSYQSALSELRALDFATQETTTALRIVLAHEPDLAPSVRDRLGVLEERRDMAVAYFEGRETSASLLPASGDADKLTALATALESRAIATDVDGFLSNLAAARDKQDELKAMSVLAESADVLKAEVVRLKDLGTLSTAKQRTATTGITNTATNLTTRYVSVRIVDNFTRETERMDLRRVTLKDRGGVKGRFNQMPGLLDANHTDAKTPAVLSEGEQTVLGLAGVFTEAEFDDSKSALVFDDPVTSLDHVRREKVALRLVELAKQRQVIVFTHDVSFVGDLLRSAESEKVPLVERTIELRGTDKPGYCSDEFPWTAKSVKTRLQWLRSELDAIKKERPHLTYSEYEPRAAAWAGHLSTTWERAVSTDVLNQIFDRGKSVVHPAKFRLLAKVTGEDDTDFQDGYGHTSTWSRRHDNAEVTNYVVPEPEVLESEYIRILEWRKRLRGYVS